MATLAVGALAIVTVGTVLGLLRHSRQRIRTLETELGQVYEAQHIVHRARQRKNRRHLHLLATLPVAWLAGRLQSPAARLAAATAASTMVAGASFVATDQHPPKQLTLPAGAETTVPPSAATVPDDDYSLSPLVPTTVPAPPVSVAAPPPVVADVEVESASSVAPAASTPSTTSTSTTTTTLLTATVPTVCVNPHGLPLPDEVCLSG